MIKNFIVYIIAFFILNVLSYNIHHYLLLDKGINLGFSLEKIYLFHTIFSAIICVNFIVLSNVDKIFEQLGFIYLATIVLKLILFCVVFYNPIFTIENLSFSERISLFIPMIIFLLTETFFVVKILKKKE